MDELAKNFVAFLDLYLLLERRTCATCTARDFQCDDCIERSSYHPDLSPIEAIRSTIMQALS